MPESAIYTSELMRLYRKFVERNISPACLDTYLTDDNVQEYKPVRIHATLTFDDVPSKDEVRSHICFFADTYPTDPMLSITIAMRRAFPNTADIWCIESVNGKASTDEADLSSIERDILEYKEHNTLIQTDFMTTKDLAYPKERPII